MTREEAIAFFKDMNECTYGNLEAVEMAIEALEQESCEDCVSRKEVFETFGELLGVWGRKALMEMPSVTPMQTWIPEPYKAERHTCGECQEWGTVNCAETYREPTKNDDACKSFKTKSEQRAYLDGFEMCAECIEKYLSNEGKDIIIVVPQWATNGDMIKTMFNCMVIEISKGKVYVEGIYFPFDEDWWNAPYKAESEGEHD